MNVVRQTMQMELIPGKRIGPFVFGQPVPQVARDLLQLEHDELDPVLEHKRYALELPLQGEYMIYVHDDESVENVDCHEKCFVGTTNLIGKPLPFIEELLGAAAEFSETLEMVDGPQDVYNIDALGLQLWFELGRLVTAQCSARDYEAR